ncbi:MAG: hypothetical protein L6V81_07740 [Clostridium sp.]|nr:MAG: hypothetical protein L6V81_07740 [Clostridium sp.]
MGLIKALSEATSSALGDQFKEFVTCPTISKNVLIQRGLVNHGKGNKNPSEGVISNGSTIVVPQGMAMMIIENGEIKDLLLSLVLSILIQEVNLVYLLVDLVKVSLILLKQ